MTREEPDIYLVKAQEEFDLLLNSHGFLAGLLARLLIKIFKFLGI